MSLFSLDEQSDESPLNCADVQSVLVSTTNCCGTKLLVGVIHPSRFERSMCGPEASYLDVPATRSSLRVRQVSSANVDPHCFVSSFAALHYIGRTLAFVNLAQQRTPIATSSKRLDGGPLLEFSSPPVEMLLIIPEYWDFHRDVTVVRKRNG